MKKHVYVYIFTLFTTLLFVPAISYAEVEDSNDLNNWVTDTGEIIEKSEDFTTLNTIDEILPNEGKFTTDEELNMEYNQFSDEEYEKLISNLEEEIRPQLIFGKDERVQINNSSGHNFRTAVRIVATWPNGTTTGCSGTLVGSNKVLTNGHCVHQVNRGGWAVSNDVTPGQTADNTAGRPYGTVRMRKQVSVQGWTREQRSAYDYAMIELQSPVGERTGWKGTIYNATNYELSLPHFMVGYPGDKPRGTLWFASGNLFKQSSNPLQLLHNIDTVGGNSGSGIYRHFSSRPSQLAYVVAVHSGYLLDGSANLSVNLSEGGAGSNVSRWINQGW